MEIQELKTHEELQQGFVVMHELRPHLNEQEYFQLLEAMKQEGYRLFGLRDEGHIVCVAGIAILTNFYMGRHVWVYDLVTASKARSKGYGEQLLKFIETFARQENCQMVALSSGFRRVDAHRFYEERLRYDKTSYVFKKIL